MNALPLVLTPLAIGAAAVVLRGSTHSRAGLWGPVVWRGCTDRPRVALTFDDGPCPGETEAVLAVLGKLNVKGTFFAIGRHVEQSPGLLQQVHDAGHLVGNHSYDHPHHGYRCGQRFWVDQIERTNAVIERAIGNRPRFFRAPMGVRTWRTAAAVRSTGMTFVTWTRRALDGLPTTADRICDRLLSGAGAGDILLLHDGTERGAKRDPSATIDALPRVIGALREKGLEPVRLDDLLAAGE